MPKYNLFRYGLIGKYGRYDLRGVGNAVGPHVRYRMRLIDSIGNKGEFVTMIQDRIEMNGNVDTFRVRSDHDEWIYTNTQVINGDQPRLRIRSIDSQASTSEWIYGERANLKQI